MPGYGKRMEKYAPEPTEEVKELDQRFKLPRFTIVQMTLISLVLVYAWSTRKMNRAALSTFMLALALLHMYDHLYRVKRGKENLFIFPVSEEYQWLPTPKKEGYCTACQK